MQDGTFKWGKRMQRTGYISHKDIYYYVHVCTARQSCNIQARKQKQYDRICYYLQALIQVYLQDTAPQHAYKNKRKDLPIGREVDRVRGPLCSWALADRIGPRDRAGYLPPPPLSRWSSSRDVPLPRQLAWTRLVPGLPRGRRTLSGAPRPNRAGSHRTAGRAAPSVRVSDVRVLHRTPRPTTGTAEPP